MTYVSSMQNYGVFDQVQASEVPGRKQVLSDTQHGFVKGRSCRTNLLETFECWTAAMEDGYGLDAVYLDFRKAFNSIPHKRLINRLKECGLDRIVLNIKMDEDRC